MEKNSNYNNNNNNEDITVIDMITCISHTWARSLHNGEWKGVVTVDYMRCDFFYHKTNVCNEIFLLEPVIRKVKLFAIFFRRRVLDRDLKDEPPPMRKYGLSIIVHHAIESNSPSRKKRRQST